MNHIIITRLSDLQNIINEPIDFSENQSPTYFPNMWALTFDDDLIKNIQLDDLKFFLTELLNNRRIQLLKKSATLQAKFYLWFDEQILQLRFNLLFDTNNPLPFGCKLDIIHDSETILKEFLTIIHQVALQGEDIEFFDPSEDFEDEDDENNYVLKVYVEIL
jgi:hypothetical protein